MLKVTICEEPLITRKKLTLNGFEIESRLERFKAYNLWPYRSLNNATVAKIQLTGTKKFELIGLQPLINAIKSGVIDLTNPQLLCKLIRTNQLNLEQPEDWCNRLTEAIQIGYYQSQR